MRALRTNKRQGHEVAQCSLDDLLRIKITGHKNGVGAVQMIVSGNIQNDECLKVFDKALHRFEDMPNIKHYLDLGGVDGFSPDAAVVVTAHLNRMAEKRSLYGIVDVSEKTTKTMKEIGAFKILEKAYIGSYINHNISRASA